MTSRRCFLLWMAGSSISLAQGHAEAQLRRELSGKGFAVGRLGPNVLRIIPFDAGAIDRRYPNEHMDERGSLGRDARGLLHSFGFGPGPNDAEEDRFAAPGRYFDSHRNLGSTRE